MKRKLSYVLIGFESFSEYETCPNAVVLSRHYNKKTLGKAAAAYNGNYYLEWKRYNNEVVGQDIADYMDRVFKQNKGDKNEKKN